MHAGSGGQGRRPHTAHALRATDASNGQGLGGQGLAPGPGLSPGQGLGLGQGLGPGQGLHNNDGSTYATPLLESPKVCVTVTVAVTVTVTVIYLFIAIDHSSLSFVIPFWIIPFG